MYSQCEPDGHRYVLFDYLTNFRSITTDLCYSDQTVQKVDGRTFLRRSTAVWKLCVLWKNRSTSWGKLSDFEELHALETVEYAASQSLEREPEFN